MNRSLLSGLAVLLSLLFLLNGVSVYASTVYHGQFRMYYRARHHHEYYKVKTVFTVDVSGNMVTISSEVGGGDFNIYRVRHHGYIIIYYISGSGVFKGYSLGLKGFIVVRGGHVFIVLHTIRRAGEKATIIFSGRV